MCLHGALCSIPCNLICNKTMEGGGMRVKYLLQCCCICDSLYIDMQHDHVLNKLTFDHRVGGADGSATKIFACCCLRNSI